jgi:hypothetical protein
VTGLLLLLHLCLHRCVALHNICMLALLELCFFCLVPLVCARASAEHWEAQGGVGRWASTEPVASAKS